jgi:tetratricopeptide (TPR) repeat protein
MTPQTADTLAQRAATRYRSGQLDEALAAYDEAARRAREQDRPDQAFDLAFTAAAIEHERHRYREALERFLALAAAPKAARASDAHLLAIHCAAQLAQSQNPPNLAAYERLLREHLERWPQAPSTAQVRGWLGRLAVERGDWKQAIETLAPTQASDPQYDEAVATIGRAYESWLAELHDAGADGQKLADEALARLEQALEPQAKRPTPASRAARLSAARIWLLQMPTGALPAERLLNEGLHDEAAPADWQLAARIWLVAALLVQDKIAEADAVLRELAPQKNADRGLLEALSAARDRVKPVPPRLAELELLTADRLLARGELDAQVSALVARQRAAALAALGRRQEALESLETLARARPRDGDTQEALARLLATGSVNELPAALAKWRDVAAHSRPGTPRYFRAHYELARLQLGLGQSDEARATIDGVEARHPDLGGAATKARFERLRAELDTPRAEKTPGRAGG